MHKIFFHLIALTAIVLMTGCAAKVYEVHYFATFDERAPEPTKPVNFFRLKIDGFGGLSSVRYLAGYYDERAVDLFFNELKKKEDENIIIQPLFQETMKEPGSSGNAMIPLSPNAGNGAFVMIMSTNADAIANAIGSFAESEVVAQAITNLVGKDKITAKLKSDAELAVVKARGPAIVTLSQDLLTEAKTAGDKTTSEAAYVRLLTTLGRALGYDKSFTDFNEARGWFTAERSAGGGR